MLQLISDNSGTIATITFVIVVIAFLYATHKSNRRDLENFYRKYPKYNPKYSPKKNQQAIEKPEDRWHWI